VLGADIRLSARAYGSRAMRFALLEAGHAAQNVMLTATEMGLATLEWGGFDDAAMRHSLAIDDNSGFVATVVLVGTSDD
jgi:SagB-type dehydrogenase family enzyme